MNENELALIDELRRVERDHCEREFALVRTIDEKRDLIDEQRDLLIETKKALELALRTIVDKMNKFK